MDIYIDEQEVEKIKELVDEYKKYYGDTSYFYHLANYLIDLMVKRGVIDRDRLP